MALRAPDREVSVTAPGSRDVPTDETWAGLVAAAPSGPASGLRRAASSGPEVVSGAPAGRSAGRRAFATASPSRK